MRLLTTILSLYILVLTSTPCIDASEDRSSQKVESAQNASRNQSDDNHHCSPFCTCQCCASPVVFDDLVIQFSSFSYAQKPLSEYSSSYVSSLFIAIWQPPKIT